MGQANGDRAGPYMSLPDEIKLLGVSTYWTLLDPRDQGEEAPRLSVSRTS